MSLSKQLTIVPTFPRNRMLSHCNPVFLTAVVSSLSLDPQTLCIDMQVRTWTRVGACFREAFVGLVVGSGRHQEADEAMFKAEELATALSQSLDGLFGGKRILRWHTHFGITGVRKEVKIRQPRQPTRRELGG
ncbi:hypothetical protein PMIN06_002937 [Paraphaeosphaeria minitans]